jgi:regulator of CtrA degradation
MTSHLSPAAPSSVTAFRDKFTLSPQFMALFNEGMDLVEQTANYLDGPGRLHAKHLKGNMAIAYATETMRLTTRLMQLASWLLLRRAVNRGEMTEDQAASDKNRVVLVPIGRSTRSPMFSDLPEALQSLIETSLKLHDRIMRLDRTMTTDEAEAITPHVNAQFDRLKLAFNP